MRDDQKMPLEGITERASASHSARAPWQTVGGVERRTNKFVLPRRRITDDLSRRTRTTRPEKDISGRRSSVRGYIKLSQAVKAFHFDFRGKTVLDIGSSTGGFTKYALDHGATKVIAVEKGTNQMMKPLRFDPRIDLHEKTDIFDFEAKPDVIMADVSFISLTKVLSYAKHHLSSPQTEFLVMLKPQFEANPNQLTSGVVKNDKIRRELIKNFEFWLKTNHFIIVNKHDNALKGKTGNQEKFYFLKLSK